MSESNQKIDDEIIPKSNELISTDVSLRNLYHFGFNSRSLTKNMINSFKFDEVVSNIKTYVESDELSLKASGHLLVGLLRVYEKKIKIFLEELMTLFKIKKPDNKETEINNKAETQNLQKSKIGKNKVNSNQKENPKIISSTADKSTISSFFNKNNHLMSLSPYNEGLFSILNENLTPNKFNKTFLNSENTNSINSTPKQIEAYRATNINSSAAMESKSKANIEFNSNIKSNLNLFEEKTIIEEENDMNNFFQFISDNVLGHPELPAEMNNENEFQSNIDIPEPKLEDVEKNFLFNSDSKPLFNFETEFSKIRQNNKNKNKKYSINLEVDEEDKMHIDVNQATKDASTEESSHDVVQRFKNEWRINVHDYEKCLTDNNNDIFHLNDVFDNQTLFNMTMNTFNSKENRRNVENDYEGSFLNNFSNLDIKDFNVNGEVSVNVHEKLTKIFEEEEKQKAEFNLKDEENNFDKLKEMDNFDRGLENVDNLNFNDSFHLGNQMDLESNKTSYSNFNEILHEILKKKKREISFTNFTENEKIKNNFPPHDTFYNLLCMAQKGEITLKQEENFKNNKIYVSIKI